MDELYSPEILALAARVPFLGALEEADAVASVTSRICGSRLKMWVRFNAAGTIARIGVELKACALGQAAAAIILPKLIQAPEETIRAGRDEFHRFLKEQGPAPAPPFAQLAALRAVRDWPGRYGAVMLPFDAALKAFALRNGRTPLPAGQEAAQAADQA